ncbi:hypothetical protein O6H91_06G009700 [Diphasiastrum complanatum]|uniref:Uncharacterized protein n=1 Tax=Diphasiastrum complanatum TaxID=34168 RepID=A0ACC2DAK4_DIPCM|nr:hypothetical protein O6H91_06G009700 [Diphasiastrum complanatum]
MEVGEQMSEVNSDGRGKMWHLDQTLDQPLGIEAGQVRAMQTNKALPLSVTLQLAFLSLGVVYGDLGTSPLYVFQSTFPGGITDTEDLLGAVSLICYTITLIPLIKYVFIVLRANDNGEGGTFALYSLICRHANVNTIPNQHPTDQKLTTYSRRNLTDKSYSSKIKKILEASYVAQQVLLIFVLLGTCMVIGDGILAPAISVLSSVHGLKVAHSAFPQGFIVILASIILVVLFSMQRFGTDKVGFMFAPVILIWFIFIGSIGVFNIVKHEPTILRALSPHYIVKFLQKKHLGGWYALEGIVLSITGAEAMFADLGHFTTRSIQIAFVTIVYPCLLAAYMGQAAFLTKYPDQVYDAFYNSTPGSVYWPMFVVATLAAIVASQATISATFSIVKQSVALGCFPRVKIVHTSNRFLGQIYIPEVNWILMILCLIVTAAFKTSTQIGNAYGIAVVGVMVVTTLLMTLIMVFIWQTHPVLVLLFFLVYMSVEVNYLFAVLFKATSSGWVPLAVAAVLLTVMYVWHYGTVKRYECEMQNKVSIGWILGLGPSIGLVRVPGIGLFYTDLAHGVPSIFSRFLTHLPALHSIVIFMCVKYLPVNTVPQEERFLVRRIGPKHYWIYRCAVRYGYKDLHKRDDVFENLLMESIASSIKMEALQANDVEESEYASSIDNVASISRAETPPSSLPSATRLNIQKRVRFVSSSSTNSESLEIRRAAPETNGAGTGDTISYPPEDAGVNQQLNFLWKAKENGVVHILGKTRVIARTGSGLLRRLTINCVYTFLRKICRASDVIYHIPQESLLNVGMVNYI